MINDLIIPDELRFAVTRKCSGRCRHCYNHSGGGEDLLSDDDFIRILTGVRQINPDFDRITITGGEPLNEPEKIYKIARFCHSMGIRVRLVTRGWELTASVCRKLKQAGVTRVQIGLDSSGEMNFTDPTGQKWDTAHSWLRCDKKGFTKTIRGINQAGDAGLDISIRFSLFRSNLGDVINTYRFVSMSGASKFKFRVLFPDGRAKNSLVHELISGEEMAYAQHQLIKASKNSKTVIELTQPCLFPLPDYRRLTAEKNEYNAYKETCPCGTIAGYIDSNGDVKYCLFDEEILGNIIDTSFLEIWNSEKADKVREKRCPLDLSGSACSAFKSLYSQFNDYSSFLEDYKSVVSKIASLVV